MEKLKPIQKTLRKKFIESEKYNTFTIDDANPVFSIKVDLNPNQFFDFLNKHFPYPTVVTRRKLKILLKRHKIDCI